MRKREYNFWPSFADLMLSFVLVVLIILFTVSRALFNDLNIAPEPPPIETKGKSVLDSILGSGENLEVAKSAQEIINEEIAKLPDTVKTKITAISTVDRQTIIFSDGALFDSGRSELKPNGDKLLREVGSIIKNNISKFNEIQIQGHADTDGDDGYNLNLASKRAISVYSFLKNKMGIDPAEHLMSATTFGEYKPVGRDAGKKFGRVDLIKANATAPKKGENRRIEILLFYNNEENSSLKVNDNKEYVLIAERCAKHPKNISLTKYEVTKNGWSRLDSFDADYDVAVLYSQNNRYSELRKAFEGNAINHIYRKCAQCNEFHSYSVCAECGKIFCCGTKLEKDIVVNCPWCSTKYIAQQQKDGESLKLMSEREIKEQEEREIKERIAREKEELRKKLLLGTNEVFIAGKCASNPNNYILFKYYVSNGEYIETNNFVVDEDTVRKQGYNYSKESLKYAIMNEKCYAGKINCMQCHSTTDRICCKVCEKIYCPGKKLENGDSGRCPWCGNNWSYNQ